MEALSYLIVIGDSLGKRYLDALKKTNPKQGEAISRMLLEQRRGKH